MSMRTSSRTVSFRRSFMLDGFDHAQPPGTYTIETDEEPLNTVSRPAYRRVATRIELPRRADRPGLTESVTIDPAELEAALANDAAADAPQQPEADPARAAVAKCP